MGGQTALNLCIEVDEKGIWEKYGVGIIGVDIDAIHITEDREQFRKLMKSIEMIVFIIDHVTANNINVGVLLQHYLLCHEETGIPKVFFRSQSIDVIWSFFFICLTKVPLIV